MKFLILFSACLSMTLCRAQDSLLTHAHAHNDYIHKRPLFEALDNGFMSIEADVYLIDGVLRVSHLPFGLESKPTLEELYIHPLDSIAKAHNGGVYAGSKAPVILMIDFKEAGDRLYPVLVQLLKKYPALITLYKGGKAINNNPVQILISGSKPTLPNDTTWATLDVSVGAMGNNPQAELTTRYSEGWGSYFSWKGGNEMPVAQKNKLDSLVKEAHAQGKQIRFYHIPDKPKVWRTLLDAGVDWINTDKLKEFRRFYLNNYNRH